MTCSVFPGVSAISSKNKHLGVLLVGLTGLTFNACSPAGSGPSVHWPDPDSLATAQLLLPGFIDTGEAERDGAFSPNMDRFLYSLTFPGNTTSVIMEMALTDDGLEAARVASFSGCYPDIEPFITPDGAWCYFASRRPVSENEELKDWDIWRVPRQGSGWGIPENIGAPVNTPGNEFYPSLSRDGTLYFTATREGGMGHEDIWFADPTSDGFAEPQVLGAMINSAGWEFNAWIHPNEDLLLYTAFGREDDLGGGDLYAAHRDSTGIWQAAIHLGPEVNSDKMDYCPSISPDNQVLIFSSKRAILTLPASPPLTDDRARELLRSPGNGRDDIYLISTATLGLTF